MNRRGAIGLSMLVVIAIALSGIALFNFFSFSGGLDSSSKSIGEMIVELDFAKDYVFAEAAHMGSFAIRNYPNDLKTAVGNLEAERNLDTVSYKGAGNFFGRIRSGDFDFVSGGGGYIMEIEDLFVEAAFGKNKLVRNFDLIVEFDSNGNVLNRGPEVIESISEFKGASRGVGEDLIISVAGVPHRVTPYSFTASKAIFEVASEPQKVEVRVGDFAKVDIDGDDKEDIVIRLFGVDRFAGKVYFDVEVIEEIRQETRSGIVVKEGDVTKIYLTMAWATYSTAEGSVAGPGLYTELWDPIAPGSDSGGFSGGELNGQKFYDYGNKGYISLDEARGLAAAMMRENGMIMDALPEHIVTEEELAEEEAREQAWLDSVQGAHLTMAWATYSTAEGVSGPGIYTQLVNIGREFDSGEFSGGELNGKEFYNYDEGYISLESARQRAAEYLKERGFDTKATEG